MVTTWSTSAHFTRESDSSSATICSASSPVTGSLNETVCKPSPRSTSGTSSIPLTELEPVATPGASVDITPSSYCTTKRPTTPSSPFVGVASIGPATSLAPTSLSATSVTSYVLPLRSPAIVACVAGAEMSTTMSPGLTLA